MFEIFADTRRLRVCKKEKITTTSAGINCLVKFSTDYVGHAIKLVFQINGKRWTVETQYNADGSTIRIPNDCFLPTTSPAWSPLNCELTCALRGEYIVEGGTTVTSRLPTVYTSMGIVEQGYDDTGAMTETAPTPSQVTQLETLVANCLSSAQMYTNMASNSATSAATSAALAANYTRRLSNMTVNAVGTSAGSTPTVTVSIVGSAYNFKFGIPKGETGATGPQGPAGADGRDGVDGADGIQGPQGPMGPAGRDGRDGTDGTNGRDGIDGQDGRDGVDGATGPQGPAGPTGPTGPEGPQGPQGPQGPEGPIKVTYHFVYGTIPAGASNPTLAEVDTWLRDVNQIHVMRYKATDSEVYKDFLYNYSNSSYHYFGGSNGLTKSYGCRIRRTGDTAGQWSSSGATLAQEADVLLDTANNFLVRYNSTDTTDRTSLANVEAAFSAGKNLILDFHVDIGSSGICDGVTGHFRYTDDLFYWYFVYATNGIRYVTLRRTGTTAGAWGTGGTTLQNSNKLAQTITGNESSTELYPTTKAVADYVTTENKVLWVDYTDNTAFTKIQQGITDGKAIFVRNASNVEGRNLAYSAFVNGAYYFGGIAWPKGYSVACAPTGWNNQLADNLECQASKTSSLIGRETYTTYYPNCKAVADYVPINIGNTLIAEYGTTSVSDISTAISNGKRVYLHADGTILTSMYAGENYYQWTYMSQSGVSTWYIIYISTGEWSTGAKTLDRTFVATYGSTTWQQIYDAFTAGKQVVCIHNGKQYNLGYCSSGNAIYFNSITTSSESYISVTTANVWNNGTIQLECSWNLNRKVPDGVNTYTVNCNTTEVYVPNATCTSLTITISQNANSRATGELFIYTKNTVPTITFTHSSNLPIYWSTGSAPTFSLNHMYEISYKVIEGKVLCVFKDWGEV